MSEHPAFRDSQLFNGDFWYQPKWLPLTNIPANTFTPFRLTTETFTNIYVTVFSGVADIYLDGGSITPNISTNSVANPPQAQMRVAGSGIPFVFKMPPGEHTIGIIAANSQALTASFVAIPDSQEFEAAFRGKQPEPSHYGVDPNRRSFADQKPETNREIRSGTYPYVTHNNPHVMSERKEKSNNPNG